MKEIKELELKKYVLATLDVPTQYLISEHFGKYSFTENIQLATKTNSRKLADTLREYFYRDKNVDFDVVVVPVRIDYVLLNEYE